MVHPLKVFKGVEFEYLNMFGVFYGLLANNGDFPRFDDFVAQLKAHLADGLVADQQRFDAKAAAIAKSITPALT